MKQQINYLKTSTIVLMFGFFLIVSQVRGQEVSYKNIWDNPYSWKSLIVNVHWFDYAVPLDLIVGVGADYQLNKRIMFSADLSKEWMGVLVNDQGLQRTSGYYEVGGTFCFANWMRNGKTGYSWTDGDPNLGGSVTKYSLSVPSKVLKQYGVRGGLLSYNKVLGSGKVIMDVKGLYAGFSIITTRNRAIDISGIRSDLTDCEQRKNFYIDVMLGPSVTYTPNADYSSIAFQNSQPYKTIGTDKDYTKYESTKWDSLYGINSLGFRMGSMWTKYAMCGLYYKFGYELGMRPGMKNDYLLLFRFAMSLGFEVPSLSNKEEKQKDGLSGE